jgi:hypothetical protein
VEQEPKTYFTAKVTFDISADNEPAVIIAELQYALNAACYELEKVLKNRSITYRLGDTFSAVSNG